MRFQIILLLFIIFNIINVNGFFWLKKKKFLRHEKVRLFDILDKLKNLSFINNNSNITNITNIQIYEQNLNNSEL
jgi:hypothetical protein